MLNPYIRYWLFSFKSNYRQIYSVCEAKKAKEAQEKPKKKQTAASATQAEKEDEEEDDDERSAAKMAEDSDLD